MAPYVAAAQRFTFCKDHFVHAPIQWEMALHCNAASHWLGAYTEWPLFTICNLIKECPDLNGVIWIIQCFSKAHITNFITDKHVHASL